MDNNTFDPNVQSSEQPAQPVQPVQGQPMPSPQMAPGQPMPGQPMMGQPVPGQPYPAQAYPQPNMRPPKQPMDPAKKKKIIMIASICSGVAVLGVVAAVILINLLRVDYSSAYLTAKELKPKVYDIYQNYDCGYVVSYVKSTYTSIKSYSEYVTGCKEVYNNGATGLVVKLGDTDGVKRNSEIKAQYEKFNAEFNAVASGSSEELDSKLALWEAVHSFNYTVDDLDYSSFTDAEFTTAANYLINSGNDTLKTYGEGWLERSLEVAAAYRTYRATTTGWSAAYNAYTDKRNELKDWVAANKPDIATIAPLNFDGTSKMYSEFGNLYSLISDTYEQNYNSGSNDCTEFLGDVYCE